MTNFLTPEEVQRLHNEEASGEGDLAGVDHALLETAVFRCQTSVSGEDAFPSIHDKAAALFSGLIELHPFADGNKRTAVVATHTFYAINGYTVVADQGEIVGVTLAVAQGYLEPNKLVNSELAHRLQGWAQPMKFEDETD
jgi:death on curing protein